MKIEAKCKYKRRNGSIAVIHTTKLPGPPYVVMDTYGITYTANGRNLNDKIDTQMDLINKID